MIKFKTEGNKDRKIVPEGLKREWSIYMDRSICEYTPIVMPRSKRYGNNYWNMLGPKVNLREVTLYSDLEYDHWVTVETTSDVVSYCEQPLEIVYVLNGKQHKTVMDMWLIRQDKSEVFIEIKYEKELHPSSRQYERTMRQIEAQKEWCHQNGKYHEVRTEKMIRITPFSIQNRVKILSNVLNHKFPVFWDELLEIIDKAKTINMSHLCNTFEGRKTTYEVFLGCHWLFYKGFITAEVDKKIWNLEMEVSKR